MEVGIIIILGEDKEILSTVQHIACKTNNQVKLCNNVRTCIISVFLMSVSIPYFSMFKPGHNIQVTNTKLQSLLFKFIHVLALPHLCPKERL